MAKDNPDKVKPLIRKGVKGPGSINPYLANRPQRQLKPVREYVQGIREGNRVTLGKAITLIESRSANHRQLARGIIDACLPFSGNSFRIGITGSPGAGKSTFIEALGKKGLEEGHRIAVLAIDPSSQVSQGSILGDKTRMEYLSHSHDVFIRPSPAGDALGGVAQQTRETIILCEAASYDLILVETVGVGQSELAVHSMTDFFLLLLLPGAGDELQGIKRGIVEMADSLIVNKSDGERAQLAKIAQREYRNALHLFPPRPDGWSPRVECCSSSTGKGIDTVWEILKQFRQIMTENGRLQTKRKEQARYWLDETINRELRSWFFSQNAVAQKLPQLRQAVLQGNISPFHAAEQLLRLIRNE